jgi:hypothetical protein
MRNLSNRVFVAGLFTLLAVGCGSSGGGGGGSAMISSSPLSGKIGGAAWTLGTAQTNSFLSMGQANYYGEMFPDTDPFTACSGSYNTMDSQLLIQLPMTMGDYSLDLSKGLTATFVSYPQGGTTPQNNIAISGHLMISSVTSTQLTGGLNISFDANNELDGQFTATICP